MWIWNEKQAAFDQAILNFAGWLLSNRSLGSPVKTVLSYLLPINAKVNEFTTILTYLRYLQGLATAANTPYVNITLDVGAAMNAFKTVWHLPEEFSNVMIHLGDLHVMKVNFLVHIFLNKRFYTRSTRNYFVKKSTLLCCPRFQSTYGTLKHSKNYLKDSYYSTWSGYWQSFHWTFRIRKFEWCCGWLTLQQILGFTFW